jgi:biopolymer transport protein ExbD
MKPTLFRLGTLVFSFIIGVAISLFFANHSSDERPLPPVVNQLSPKCANLDALVYKGENLVISVPNDNEFYIGKKKVEALQITARIRQLFGNVNFCDRIVFIKGASHVTLQSLDQVVREVKAADVNRIEFVLDKKKRGPNSNQSIVASHSHRALVR